MKRFDPLIEGYFSYLKDVGRKAPRTVIDVRCTLKRVLALHEELQPGAALWKRPLSDHLRWLERERELGRSTGSIAKDLSHVRGLLEYAWRTGRAERNVLDGFSLADPGPRPEPACLSIEEARQLVEACPAGTFAERRERLVILMLYGCGLRTGELCAADIAHINRERRDLEVPKAKGDRPRTIPIPSGVFTQLLAYLLERGQRGALFRTTVKRRRLSAGDVCEIVAAALARTDIAKKVTPKTLRHSFASHLMDRGVDVAVIASLMGHRSPYETGIYLHAMPGRCAEAVQKIHWEDRR